MGVAAYASELALKELDLVEAEIREAVDDSDGAVKDMCIHVMESGGKRIRPMMLLCSGLVFGGDTGLLVKAAAAAELIHMASLVHDDIIDRSDFRRSRPSVCKLWGNLYSVLCGDYLFAKAFGILSRLNVPSCMDYMVEAISSMCSGEVIQAGNRNLRNADIESYYRQITEKTAKFLECCCKAGACIAGASAGEVQALGGYGLNLGLSFQIVDDILDFKGDIGIMGKPKFEDLRQGIVTLPILLLLKKPEYKKRTNEILGRKEYTQSDLKHINEYLSGSGAIDEATAIATMHVKNAGGFLEKLPDSPYTAYLQRLTDEVLNRDR